MPQFQSAPPARRLPRWLPGRRQPSSQRSKSSASRRGSDRASTPARPHREIRKVFRPVAKLLPEYDLFEVKRRQHEGGGGAGEGAPVAEASPSESPSPPSPPDTLYPPGPLASVKIDPARSRLLAGATRLLKARALDADARPCAGEVSFEWSLAGAGALAADGARATYAAPEHPAAAQARVVARQGAVAAEAAAEVEVLDELREGGGSGVPEPVPVHAPAEGWRSRVLDGKWEYNTGHKDYGAAALDERRRLRYLVHLFAKEVVLRNFGQPADAATLERMVEVLTYLGDARRPAKRED